MPSELIVEAYNRQFEDTLDPIAFSREKQGRVRARLRCALPIVPVVEPALVEVPREALASEREEARMQAEASRHEVPAVLAARLAGLSKPKSCV